MLIRDLNKQQSIHPYLMSWKDTSLQAGIMVRQCGSKSHKHPPPTKLWFSHLCQRVSYDYNNCYSKNLFNMSRNMGMLPVFWIMLCNQVPVPGQHAQVSGMVKMSWNCFLIKTFIQNWFTNFLFLDLRSTSGAWVFPHGLEWKLANFFKNHSQELGHVLQKTWVYIPGFWI